MSATTSRRRMATRLTPDPDSSVASENSSYRDLSRDTLDNSEDDKNDSSDDIDEVDASHVSESRTPRKSPNTSGSSKASPSARKRKASPRGRGNIHSPSSKLYPNLAPESSPSSIYPDLYEQFKKDLSQPSSRTRTDSGGSPRVRYQSARSNIGPSPRRKTHERAQAQNTDQNLLPVCMICFIIIIGFITYIFLIPILFSPEMEESNQEDVPGVEIRQDLLDSFKAEMKPFQEMFTGQSHRFWNVLKAATKRVLKEPHPLQPAVIIIAGNNKSRQTMNCLIQKYSELITKVYGAASPVVIGKDDTLSSYAPKDLKLHLDQTLTYSFYHKAKAAVIHDVEKLPGEAAMIFHAYCDNENAPHKDVVILFTVDMETETAKSEEDYIVESFLTKKYSVDLDTDSLSALLSRIANNIAYVKPESDEILRQHC